MFEPETNGGLGDESVAAKWAALSNTLPQSLEFHFRLRFIHQGRPLPWPRDGPFRKDPGVSLTRVLATPQTTVFPVLRQLHQIGTESISFNVTITVNRWSSSSTGNVLKCPW